MSTENNKNTFVLESNTIPMDSSSLILLAKSSMLDKTIKNMKRKPVIVQEVKKESTRKNTFDSKLIEKRVKEGKIKEAKAKTSKDIKTDFNLGKGEAQALTYALKEKTGIITDDKKAINAAKILNIPFTTAPNLLVTLKQQGKMTKKEAKTHWKKLKEHGRYSKEIKEEIEKELEK